MAVSISAIQTPVFTSSRFFHSRSSKLDRLIVTQILLSRATDAVSQHDGALH
jgi:hypothetical protein